MTKLAGRRTLAALAASIAFGGLAMAPPLLAPATPAAAAGIRAATRPAKAPQPVWPPAYDLVSAAGAVTNLGGAGFYGQASGRTLKGPIVGIDATADGRGYWLVASDGGIFTYGDGHFYGSAGALDLNAPVVGMAGTHDRRGYWLVASDGGIFTYGDGHFYGSAGAEHLNAPIVGMAATPDGRGYWLVASDGGVFRYGDADFYGSAGAQRLNSPIVGMAATPDGRGYWLVASDGGVFCYGDAHFFGSGAGALGAARVSGIAPTPDGKGYWMTTTAGRVSAFGDAPFHGDGTARPGSPSTTGISPTAAVTRPAPSPYHSHSIGYDINWPQCQSGTSNKAGVLPGPPSYPAQSFDYTVAIVGVDGWAVDSPNPCLGAEVAWAKRAVNTAWTSYSLYMLLNAPSSTSTIDGSGPAGRCAAYPAGSGAWQRCLAYNYGWNSARIAFSYAGSQGASSQVWWLDIENASCSSSNFNGGFGAPWSCNRALNDETLQGAINELRGVGVTVGIYSTSLQWGAIMGSYVPSGPRVPLWIAGAYWTSPPYPLSDHFYPESSLGPWCAGAYNFAGGAPWILQETPGSTNYPYDPNYAC